MFIYVAGPLSAQTFTGMEEKANAAADIATALLKKGHQPFLPHLSLYWDRRARATGVDISYEEWLELDFKWIENCDALFYIAPSPGTDRELAHAEAKGIPVYRSLDEVP